MSIKLSICIVLLALLCCYTQGTFAKQQQQNEQQGALEGVNSNLSENNNEAENFIGEQSKLKTVLRKPSVDEDDEDNDDVDGARRRRRRGRRGGKRRNRRGRRRGRRGGRRRGRRGGRRRRRNRLG